MTDNNNNNEDDDDNTEATAEDNADDGECTPESPRSDQSDIDRSNEEDGPMYYCCQCKAQKEETKVKEDDGCSECGHKQCESCEKVD
ncbi:hypothetical protein SPI_03496 [Niveomyces insectorum RCEF 264]|uniref:Uncharacterized protein n=1 Tax=Niveomyces insectorum RCEF 264 TaxID=1081102 RepID=A0A167W4L3_9HYPO|nr:hypothetical protein SPI_03496 [Niveomyces insectorum RCEF 264]